MVLLNHFPNELSVPTSIMNPTQRTWLKSTVALSHTLSLRNVRLLSTLSNNKIVADRIILKIESHFEETCDECNEEYRNKFGGTPATLRCFLCVQGSHNCAAMTQKLQGYDTFVANKPTGCIWMCRGCRLKNDLINTNNNKKKEVQFQANNPVSATSESRY